MYGAHGPLNNNFAPLGGVISRACLRNSSTRDLGVRKASETRRPRRDEETSRRCPVNRFASRAEIRSASSSSSGASVSPVL